MGVDATALRRQTRGMSEDFLTEIIDERTGKNPGFPALVAEAKKRRKLARVLTTRVVRARAGYGNRKP